MNDEHKEGEKYEAGHEAPEEHGSMSTTRSMAAAPR